ncbi:hypothetical protein L0F76_13885, partial [Staphylococcus aureus]|nr:hypothetical protein [Staphylococcus aureus]
KHHFLIISSQNGSRQAKKERKRNSRSGPFQPEPNYRIPKKIAKKFQKLEKIILALFQAKTGQERPKKREKEILVPDRFHPTQTREFRKKIAKEF